MKNGVTFEDPRELDVVIFYDPTPHALTRGQVARTYCYDAGRPTASLRTPAGLEFHYTEDEYETSYTPCPNPYDVPVDAPAPETHDEALEVFQNAYDAAQSAEEQSITVQWITARNWKAEAEEFAVTVDIRDLLAEHGEGVYSVVLWGYIGDEPVLLSEYSVFYASTGSAVGDRYDANHNGVIDGPDVIQAVRDYFANIISGPEVIEVVRLYFAGRSWANELGMSATSEGNLFSAECKVA